MELPFPPTPPDAAGVTLIVIDSVACAYSQIMQNPFPRRQAEVVGRSIRPASSLEAAPCPTGLGPTLNEAGI
jgi:hypothetical protein